MRPCRPLPYRLSIASAGDYFELHIRIRGEFTVVARYIIVLLEFLPEVHGSLLSNGVAVSL
jgi:hypothetical protein